MLKAAVISVEWDKKNNKILYLGTMNSSLVKVYDINLKKVIQDLELNKEYMNCLKKYNSVELCKDLFHRYT